MLGNHFLKDLQLGKEGKINNKIYKEKSRNTEKPNKNNFTNTKAQNQLFGCADGRHTRIAKSPRF